MPANFTEGSFDSSGTGQTLDSSPVACTETVTFTEVVEGKEWGSFYYSFKTEQLITLWVLFVFTIVGNSVVLFSTWRRKKKSRMTFFVTQLAITEKQARVLIVIAWSLSFLFSIPTLIIFGKRTLSNGEVQCWALWPDDSYWTPYMTIVAFLVYFIPLTIISIMYGIVIRTIWIKSKTYETVISNCSDGKLCSSYNRGLISKAKIKAIKYSIIIILAFICCWSPYFLFDILDNFNLLPDTQERFYASVIIQNLPALNSAINPLIYCVFSSSISFPCREQRSQDSRMTFRERTERHEMQILSKPEFI
ncbi:neuropeptide S receptor 1 [Homo sapiens]|uniref:Isoform 2 of Neuropeptide S receptor n=1 Tax=Homo sapiens TaxID=9606 RepID=Q6W5P4-2|nr:neuropeptide S receptor isoform F [Homo sapiens]AAQ76972.1 GPRA isoform F [Homo sapiens]KAI4013449.1 neuropeptide S receptor 1 [Homo sapiens]|eukprot:NP_001287863.1 neuropeptide S receptor isoform F [Homo sapiens]